MTTRQVIINVLPGVMYVFHAAVMPIIPVPSLPWLTAVLCVAKLLLCLAGMRL